jgi:hypothetical protein
MLEYEPFSIYEFHTVYPATWKVELNPKSDRKEGDVAFKSPERENFFVSWGPLEKAKKKYSSLEEHADDPFRRIKKNPSVRKVEFIQKTVMEINSHKAIFSHAKVTLSKPNIIPFTKDKTAEREIRCMHIDCEPTGRYFVVYGEMASDKASEYGEVFENMVKSFLCHKKET